MSSVITEGKPKETQRWGLFFFFFWAEFWSVFPDLVSTWVITSSCMMHHVNRICIAIGTIAISSYGRQVEMLIRNMIMQPPHLLNPNLEWKGSAFVILLLCLLVAAVCSFYAPLAWKLNVYIHILVWHLVFFFYQIWTQLLFKTSLLVFISF